MAIWYCDYANPASSDSNTGTSWATSFKTLNAVTSAKGFVSGDTIRFAKAMEPTSLGQTAQWTDLSKTVTLTTAVTKNIDLCDVAWTKAGATSTSAVAGGKQNNSIQVVTGTNAANTLMAYHATGTLDLSAYQQVSFWVYTNTAIGASTNWTLCLCSDTAGQTIVYSIPIPPIPATTTWTPIAFDLGSPMTTAIQSVALYSGSTPQNTVTISFDNILACKAPSAPDALTLLSLISKNNGVDPWVSIQSINDTVVAIDNYVTGTTSSSRGYAGTTENVNLYKREAIRTPLTVSATVLQSTQFPSGATATISGGWNVSTGLQDGETIFDGQNSMGYGLGLTSNWCIYLVENISMVRYNYGIQLAASPGPGCTFKLYQLVNNQTGLYNASSLAFNCTVTIANAFGNTNAINGLCNSVITIANAVANSQVLAGGPYGNIATLTTCRNNQYGLFFGTSGAGLLLKDSALSNNSTTDLSPNNINGSAPILLKNVTYSTINFSVGGYTTDMRIISQNDQKVPGATKIMSYQFTIVNDSSITHTAGGMSWKMTPSGGGRTLAWPGWLVIGRIFCAANQPRTFSAWVRRDHATNVLGALVIRGQLVYGIPNTVMTNASAAINTWEQLSLSVTPTEDAIIEVEAWCWGTANNMWVADFSAS